jgi:AcrR family transcriptional regulator
MKEVSFKQSAISDAQKEMRRQQILEAALWLYQATSFEQVSMAQVAREAGVAKGTVYLYFKTKEELFLGVLAAEFVRWFNAIDAELSTGPWAWSVPAVVDIIGRSLETRAAFVRLIAISNIILERNIDAAAALAFKKPLARHIEQTGALLERAFPA